MHLSDGILPPIVWTSGWVLGGAGVALALQRFDEKRLPELGVLTSLFFVASLVHVRLGVASVHLQFAGLAGIILGSMSWPSLLIALLLQAILLGHGGLTTLGINTLVMGSGASASWLVFQLLGGRAGPPGRGAACAFLATFSGFAVSGGLFILVMLLGGKPLGAAGAVLVAGYAPVAIVESAVTAATAAFLLRVRPEMLRQGAGGLA